MIQRTDLTPIIKDKFGKRFLASVIYPTIEVHELDRYIVVSSVDRLDLIANDYYNKPSYWIIIALANDGIGNGTLYVPAGTQLRIPYDPSRFDTELQQLNAL